jgi:S-DNA-T family DNA segregation ATPase FtsK/SpoIIIE
MGWLRPTVGRLDIPQECRQEPFVVDLAAAHLAVIGASASGKTTLLRTLLLALAASHTPVDLWLYLVDAGGQGLAPLAGLPHVAALIQARERERVRRLIRMLDAAIRERQDRLRAADAPDLSAYREAGGRGLPALLLVIDGLAALCEEFRDALGNTSIIDDLVRLARVGRPYGVHLLLSAERAGDVSYRLLSLCDGRVAMRQADAHDYADVLGVGGGALTTAAPPGRGLWAHPDYGPLELQVALPSLEPPGPGDEPAGAEASARAFDGEQLADLRGQAAALAAAWRAHPEAAYARPQPVELLPDRLPLADLSAPVGGWRAGMGVPIGRESLALGVAGLRLDAETPHALVVGPRRSGKTTALRTILCSLAAANSAIELLILDSPRGGLADLRDLSQTVCYARGAEGAAALVAAVADQPDASGSERHRVIVIDDYSLCRERLRDQLAQSYGPEPNLLAALCDLAQGGGQPGTHILLATSLAYADDALLRALDGGRNGLILWPGRYESGTRLLGVSLPLAEQRDAEQPPGRALLVQEDSLAVVQIAQP